MSVELKDLAFESPEEATELYRLAGRALWAFTYLEFHIAHHTVYVFGKPYATHHEREQQLLKAFDLTLGNLLKELRKCCTISPEIDVKLKAHYENRNWLCHNFYREAHLALYKRPELLALFSKLNGMKENAQELVVIFDTTFDSWCSTMGITPEALHEQDRKIIEQWKAS